MVIGKAKLLHTSHLPQKITVNEINLFDKAKIANEFNKFFANIGIEPARKIPTAKTTFETYVETANSTMESNPLYHKLIERCILFFKDNSPGYDETSFNVVKKCFGELYDPLKFIFDLSLGKGIFPDDLKIARVTPVFKAGDRSKLGHQSPISVLSCFSKTLEHIMYNRIYKYLLENKILYLKQFGFQFGHSTDHAIIQSVNQIFEASENNFYTLGVFIDISKASGTVDHRILLKKLELYGIKGNNHKWIKSFLSNREQYFEIDPTVWKL